MKYRAISVLLGASMFLLAACAGQSEGPDWSGAEHFRVVTEHGDRVSVWVLGDVESGFQYRARIRHIARPNTDTLDRQDILAYSVRAILEKQCGTFEQERPVHDSNVSEETGRFTCTK